MQGYKAAAIALVVAILVFAAASVPPTGAAAPSSGARRLEAAAAPAPSPASAAESGSNAWLGWLVGAGGCVAAVAALVFLCSEPQDDDGDTVGSNATNAVKWPHLQMHMQGVHVHALANGCCLGCAPTPDATGSH